MKNLWEKEELENIEAQKFIEASRIEEKQVQFPSGILVIKNIRVENETLILEGDNGTKDN